MPDLLSIYDLKKRDIELLLSESKEMDAILRTGKPSSILSGKIVANMFFEASTRTNFSFQTSAARLGATPLSFLPERSSVQKGETFEDTIRIIDGYADALVIRHPDSGSASKAADYAAHPVINAGDGGNQHPSQTLIDLYTIQKLKGRLKGLNVSMMGDLKYARAMRSLLHGLSMFGAEITLISPPSLRMDKGLVQAAKKEFGASITEAQKPNLSGCDILYVCRVQKERCASEEEAKRAQSEFRITEEMLAAAGSQMAVLHPLPKIDELPKDFNSDPRARYFEQAKNGIPVRMAVLKRCILGK
jgi:aspartate carbamoyltransferase catalytic subunit